MNNEDNVVNETCKISIEQFVNKLIEENIERKGSLEIEYEQEDDKTIIPLSTLSNPEGLLPLILTNTEALYQIHNFNKQNKNNLFYEVFDFEESPEAAIGVKAIIKKDAKMYSIILHILATSVEDTLDPRKNPYIKVENGKRTLEVVSMILDPESVVNTYTGKQYNESKAREVIDGLEGLSQRQEFNENQALTQEGEPETVEQPMVQEDEPNTNNEMASK